MARTRAQRRRQNLVVTAALVATLLVLLFAHDVNRAAHSTNGVLRSENRSFAGLANELLGSEQRFADHLGYLLGHGATLSRPVFDARLTQLSLQLPGWATRAGLLRHPAIAGDLNLRLATLTEQRVDDYQVVLAAVATALDLPWSPPASSLTSVAARASLLATDRTWNAERSDLARAPGRVRLDATATPGAVVTLPTVIGALVAAPSLRVVRAVALSAVEVTPSPLPAPAGRLVLPPVTSVHLGVSVTNDAFVEQPVVLSVTLTVLSGAGATQSQTMAVTLRPGASYAFIPRLLTTAPGERARLTLSLRGTPGAPAPTQRRTYQVVLSSSGG